MYDEVKAEIRAIQQQMVEAKKNDCAKALEDVNLFCKGFVFTSGMLRRERSND